MRAIEFDDGAAAHFQQLMNGHLGASDDHGNLDNDTFRPNLRPSCLVLSSPIDALS